MKKWTGCLLSIVTGTMVCLGDDVTIRQGQRYGSSSEVAEQRVPRRPAQSVASSPVMVSLIAPVQLPLSNWDVTGFRLSIIYGKCVNLTGLDIGIAGHTKGFAKGLQIAAVNVVEGDFAGVQIGVANYAASSPGSMGHGMQIGVFNGAESYKGFQLGVINYAGRMSGVQVGLVNVIKNKDVAFLPIVNAAF